MLEAAIESGDRNKVAAVVEVAIKTNPDDAGEIETMHRSFQREQSRLAARQKAREEAEIRNAGMLDYWEGEGQIGAFQSSGNSDTAGVTASLSLTRQGIDWSHKLRGAIDYQRSKGTVSREQYLVAYEPRYEFSPNLFVFGIGQYEQDRFQGFSDRYTVSAGVGQRVVDNESVRLSLQAGPTWRRTEFVSGLNDSHFAGLAALDFDWQITNALSLTEDGSIIVEQGNTSILSATGLEAGVANDLKARISYTVDYDSNPPPGAVQTDTTTRFTLVYGF